MLDLAHLSRRFGATVALDDLSFTVPPGEVFGFLGPNGAGKTTAMRAILGVTALDAGEVRWHGRAVDAASRRRFGYLPEERGLYPSMGVTDQLTYLGELHGMRRPAARRSAADWLARLGLAGRGGDRVEALSLGNQQRVQLAAALVHDPELVVLDEPFSGIDPAGVDTMRAVLSEAAGAGKAVLFSSHQLDLVEDLCVSVAIVDSGRLVAAGKVVDLVTAGRPRLVVGVAEDQAGRWADSLVQRGAVEISENRGGMLRLVLAGGTSAEDVLDIARTAGRLQHFAIERRRLSEVFREAVTQ